MGGRAAALLVGLVVLVAGCAGTAPAGHASDSLQRSLRSPDVHRAWESCAAAGAADGDLDGSQDALALPVLGADFVPVAAVVCGGETQQRPTGGSDLVAVEDQADEVTARCRR
ncbi:hypothetical protein Vqi01_07710 [Micromonospora qiuiae]|uniref:Lipoprotein n=2 Tax=Micromonospora qiuiae TaxID=502268 RepID=A0ABQ4J620_9ACTN|nr:hypothetical protein Vqi01_07710 [Micromonospora qiuiae]